MVFVYAYHRVFQKKSSDIGLSLFEFHIKVFKKFFYILSWEEFKAYLRGEFFPPKKGVLITFDDGYADNYVYAYPILKKYNARAVLFITASRILDKDIKRKTLFDYWEGKVSLRELFKPTHGWLAHKEYFQRGYSEQFLSWGELNEMADVFDFGSHGISHSEGFISQDLTEFVNPNNIDRIYSLWNIYKPPKIGYPIFKRKSDLVAPIGRVKPQVLEFIEKKIPSLKGKNFQKQLKEELLKNFSTFLDFENFEEYLQRVRKDLTLSKELIEKNLPIKAEAFAYPWGHYSENLLREVKRIYKYAFTVEKDIVQPQKVNSLLIPRVYAVKDIFTFLKHLLVYGTEKGYRWFRKPKREKVI